MWRTISNVFISPGSMRGSTTGLSGCLTWGWILAPVGAAWRGCSHLGGIGASPGAVGRLVPAGQLHVYILYWNEVDVPVPGGPGVVGCYLLALRRPGDPFLQCWRA